MEERKVMLKSLSNEEVELLAISGEWEEVDVAVNCRKYDSNYVRGIQKTNYEAVINGEGRIIAVFGYELVTSKRSGVCLYISPLCVHSDYRGIGIGSGIIELLKIVAKKTEVKLMLYAHESVQGFYEKNGFKPVYDVEENYKAMEFLAQR